MGQFHLELLKVFHVHHKDGSAAHLNLHRHGGEEADMFEIIRSGITFDLAKLYGGQLSNITELGAYAMCENAVWLEVYPYYKQSLDAQLEQMVENFRQYQAQRDAN